jgi:phosphoribosylaminoimidazole (AIR) synthetase
MSDIVELGKLEIKEAYRTWNMGIGLAVICSINVVDQVFQTARQFGCKASVIGAIDAGNELSIAYPNGEIEVMATD